MNILKKNEKNEKVEKKLDVVPESLALGHLIKYNLYLLSKAIVFASLYPKSSNITAAVSETESVLKAFYSNDHSNNNQES